ncbi:MAG: hypothetical protein FJ096_14960 [Deltaproteobacteria bacterium]|nr:hypothetical protein [Deltaproteobacteria bacterium]
MNLVRSLFLPSLVSLVVGCSSDGGEPAPKPECDANGGTVTGTIRFGGDPRPKALALFRRAPEDTPLQVMAEETGTYQVELDAGAWLVDGEDGAYCKTSKPASVTVEACGSHTVDLELDCVL